MIGVQRQLKDAGKDWRAFEILNLGRYERSAFLGVETSFAKEVPDRAEDFTPETIEDRLKNEKQALLEQKTRDFHSLIMQAYRGEGIA